MDRRTNGGARLLVAALLAVTAASAAPALADDFDEISYDDIVAAELSGEPIPAHDDERNQIPTGTIVLYRTVESRYGKLLVEEYAENLTLRWYTYAMDGAAEYTSGSGLVIRATWACDLDEGQEVSVDGADFSWNLITEVERFLAPANEAAFAVYGGDVPTQSTSWSAVRRRFDP